MVALACGLLALGVVAFLITPLLYEQRRRVGRTAETEDLLKKKDFLYAAIRELNIDFNMGKLSAEDHRQLQAEYMREASAVLDRLEQKNGKPDFNAQIEQEVRTLRQRRPGSRPQTSMVTPQPVTAATIPPSPPLEVASSEPAPESAVSEPVQDVEAQTCPQCGVTNEADANFCVECGAPLTQFLCANCGKPYKPQSKFCSDCGQRL